jgi:probable HAF family extracellular repeat protein
VLAALGKSTSVTAINSAGTLVGASGNSSLDQHAVAWIAGALVDLGARTGGASSTATAIDDDGRIAVLDCTPSSTSKGCSALIVTDTDVVDLGSIPDEIAVLTMSTQGLVVGSAPGSSPPSWYSAVAWSGGNLTRLEDEVDSRAWPSLGVSAGSRLGSSLVAVAANGDVIGEADIAISEGAAMAPFLWKNGTLIDLQAVVEPATRLHSAFAINAKGQILATVGEGLFSGRMLLTPR